jgi:hypothetical protein
MDPSGAISHDPGLSSKELRSFPEKSDWLSAKPVWINRNADRVKKKAFTSG